MLTYYDANCQVGRYNHRLAGAPYSVESCLEDMHERGIQRRLVHHAMAKEYSPAIGNERLRAETVGAAELVPCWAVAGWATGEVPPPEALIARMQAAGVRAARFFWCYVHEPAADWALGRLWAALAEARLPLFLDMGERWATMDDLDADAVHCLCAAHPRLPVVLTKHRIRYNRQVYALLDTCPNLRLELSGYWHYRGVEEITRRFGPERLLFGTNWPYMDSGFAVAAVAYADVSEQERALVAGGNLATLLEAATW